MTDLNTVEDFELAEVDNWKPKVIGVGVSCWRTDRFSNSPSIDQPGGRR